MKLHPLTVPYRLLTRGSSIASTLIFLVIFGGELGLLDRPLLLAVGVVTLLALGVAWEVAHYRRFDYELTADTLDIDSGVLSRRRREIPLHRVQNVDVRRNVVQRALGIAAVGLETAGGGETEASLRFVAAAEAARLQREIRRRKEGVAPTDEAEPEPETLVFQLSDEDLALLSALSLDPRILSVIFVALPFVWGYLPDGLAGAALFAVITLGVAVVALAIWATGAAATFARYFGFRLTRVGDDLRYERGLLQRYDGTIPLEKVQTFTIRENALMRRFGYASLSVETAGYSPGESPSGGSQAAIPLAPREELYDLARTLDDFGDLAFERPPERARRRYAIRYALVALGVTAVVGLLDYFLLDWGWWFVFLGLVALAPLAARLTWRHRGYHVGDRHVVTRAGFWQRRTHVVPYYRVQTVIRRRTIFQRRWDLATVIADTAGSSGLVGGDARAIDLDGDDATRLRDLVVERLGEQLAAVRSGTAPAVSPVEDAPGGSTDPGADDATGDASSSPQSGSVDDSSPVE